MSYVKTSAIVAQQTQLQRGDGASPENFTTVAEITSVKPPAGKLKTLDATSFDSPNYTEEVIPGLITPGECSLEGHLIAGDAQQQGLYADMYARVLRNFKVVLPNELGHYTFSAFVTEFASDLSPEKIATFTAKLTVSQGSTFTAGS